MTSTLTLHVEFPGDPEKNYVKHEEITTQVVENWIRDTAQFSVVSGWGEAFRETYPELADLYREADVAWDKVIRWCVARAACLNDANGFAGQETA